MLNLKSKLDRVKRELEEAKEDLEFGVTLDKLQNMILLEEEIEELEFKIKGSEFYV